MTSPVGRHILAGPLSDRSNQYVIGNSNNSAVTTDVSSTAALTLANVLYEKRGAIAYVTVNRPKVLNALNEATWQDLRTAFEDAQNDAAVRGVILTGAGDKAFIAGADIGDLAQASAIDAERSSRFGQEVLDLIENLGKPVIAAINGFALGGGCETAMACTIRIAVEHAKFGQPEVKLGIASRRRRHPAAAAAGRQGPRAPAHSVGRNDRRQEAYRIGLVNEVVPAADLIPRAEAILKEIVSNAPLAVRYALDAINKGMETSQTEGLALEASYFGLCAGTEDKKEGTVGLPRKSARHNFTVADPGRSSVSARITHQPRSHQWQTKTFSQD